MFRESECIHFVFADREDRYFCSSGLILPWERYLLLNLHKAGYSDVRFLRKNGSEWLLEEEKIADEAGLRWNRSCEDTVIGVLTDLLNGKKREKKTAVVTELSRFADLSGNASDKSIRKLIAAASDVSRRNILVLCASENARESYPCLFEKKVFRTWADGTCLCVPAAAAQDGVGENPFGRLMRQCRDSENYLVFNSRVMPMKEDYLVREQLQALADCLLLRHNAWAMPEEDCLAPFLYGLMRSRRMRLNVGVRQHSFQSVYECLASEDGWKNFLAYMKTWTEDEPDPKKLIAYLRDNILDFEEIEGGVAWRDDISRDCGETDLPGWYHEKWPDTIQQTCRTVTEIRRRVLAPRKITNETAKENLRNYMERYRREMTYPVGDCGHLENIFAAALMSVSFLGKETLPEGFEECCRCYDDLLETERRYFLGCQQRRKELLLGTESLLGTETEVQRYRESLENARRRLELALKNLNWNRVPDAVRAAQERNEIRRYSLSEGI